MRLREERDAGVAQKPGDRRRCIEAEVPQRSLLRRDERQRDVHTHRERTLRGQQGQLVERQRPRGAARDHEDDALHRGELHVLDQPVHRLGILEPAERHATGVRGALERAHREDEIVIGHALAAGGGDGPGIDIDGGERILDELRVDLAAETADVVATQGRAGERILNAERSDPERGIGCQQGEEDAVSGEAAEREHRLQAADSAAGDDDACGGGGGHAGTVAARTAPAIRRTPHPGCGFPATHRGAFADGARRAPCLASPRATTTPSPKGPGHHVADLHRRVRRQRRISCRCAAGRRARRGPRRRGPRGARVSAADSGRSARAGVRQGDPAGPPRQGPSRHRGSGRRGRRSARACWPVRRRRRCTTSRRRSRRRSSSSAQRTTATSAASRRGPWRRTCCTEPRAPCSSPRPTTSHGRSGRSRWRTTTESRRRPPWSTLRSSRAGSTRASRSSPALSTSSSPVRR